MPSSHSEGDSWRVRWGEENQIYMAEECMWTFTRWWEILSISRPRPGQWGSKHLDGRWPMVASQGDSIPTLCIAPRSPLASPFIKCYSTDNHHQHSEDSHNTLATGLNGNPILPCIAQQIPLPAVDLPAAPATLVHKSVAEGSFLPPAENKSSLTEWS